MDGQVSETALMAEATLPFFPEDTKKSRYLSYRVAYFTVMEAIQLSDTSLRSVKRWREDDPLFAFLDGDGLSKVRDEFGRKYLDIEFTRNYYLVLQQDLKVLIKSAMGNDLTKAEHDYLLKIRTHYTPQQLGFIKQLSGEVETPEEFDFTKLTFTLRREKQEIEITGERSVLPQVSGETQ